MDVIFITRDPYLGTSGGSVGTHENENKLFEYDIGHTLYNVVYDNHKLGCVIQNTGYQSPQSMTTGTYVPYSKNRLLF